MATTRTEKPGDGPGRTVILHADDFGMNAAVNSGILRAFREGCLTSTSLLVNAPQAEAALLGWRELEFERRSLRLPSFNRRSLLEDATSPFDLGLHLNLTQGMPLTESFPACLRSKSGTFLPIGTLYRRMSASGEQFADPIRNEIAAQVRWLTDRGVTPTHVNGHQYVELIPAVAGALGDVLERIGVFRVRFPVESSLTESTLSRGRPIAWFLALVKRAYAVRYLRVMRRRGFEGPGRFFGTAHAGRVTLDLVRRWIDDVPKDAVVEIGLHPAAETKERSRAEWDDPLACFRPGELDWIVSQELVETLRQAGCHLGRIAG